MKPAYLLIAACALLACADELPTAPAAIDDAPGTEVTADAATASTLLSGALAPRIYWSTPASSPSRIGSANPDGTDAVQLLVRASVSTPAGPAIDEQYVYWPDRNGNRIGRAHRDGTNPEPAFIPGAAGPSAVAVDGQHVYWANRSNGTIGRANLDGSGVDQAFISGGYLPFGVAVDANYIYWANQGTNTIGRAKLDGTGVQMNFIAGTSIPYGVAVDGEYVYWVNNFDSSVGRAKLDGTDRRTKFFRTSARPTGIAVDGENIYYTMNGWVARANLDGSDPTPYLQAGLLTTGIAVLSAPVSPGGVSAVAGDAHAIVSFNTPPRNGSPISGYTVSAAPGGPTATGNASPITVTGLENGTMYTFTVQATNGVGIGVHSAPSNAVTPEPPYVPPVDDTPPVITHALSGTSGENGWFTSDVGVDWSVTDDVSPASASCAHVAHAANTTADGVTYTCSAVSAGGSATSAVMIRVDRSAPVVTAAVDGVLGDDGWYTSDVHVTFAVSDDESGVASSPCPAGEVTSDAVGATFGCAATNGAGLGTTEHVTVKRDATPPMVALVGNAGTYGVDDFVIMTCEASDNLSGIASQSCSSATNAAWTFGPGTHAVAAAATDNAGNSASVTGAFEVVVTPAGLCGLVKAWIVKQGTVNSLCRQLENGAYRAFENHLRAQTGKSVTVEVAQELMRLLAAL